MPTAIAGVCFGIVTMAAAETDTETTPAASQASSRSPRAARIPTYGDMIRRWHAVPSDGPALTPEGRAVLAFEILNTEERIELSPVRDDGGWTDDDLERASHALRDPRNNQERSIDARVLDLAYRVQTHFQVNALRVVSCYRRGGSKHGKGRAIDIVVPGARDEEVARFARTFGFVGVGLYPRSGFIHLDTRPRSYFWVDSSGPGQKSRSVQVFGRVGEESDARAVERGETPPVFTGEEGGTAGDDAEGASKAQDSDSTKGRSR